MSVMSMAREEGKVSKLMRKKTSRGAVKIFV